MDTWSKAVHVNNKAGKTKIQVNILSKIHIVRSTATKSTRHRTVRLCRVHTLAGARIAGLRELAPGVDPRLAVTVAVALLLFLVCLIVEDVTRLTFAGSIKDLEGAVEAVTGAGCAS